MKQRIDACLEAIAEGGQYQEFNKKIVNTDYEVLGVRMPAMRALARQIAAEPWVDDYLAAGADTATYEHVLLYGLVLAQRSKKLPIERTLELLDALIPHFDNWAHVDVILSSFKQFAKHREVVHAHFLPLSRDQGEFTKRTWVILLMDFFLDAAHIDRTLEELIRVPQGQYYVDMAIAWAVSVALVKDYERTLPLLERPVFTKWVHNKAIQKARESFRITADQKEELNALKLK